MQRLPRCGIQDYSSPSPACRRGCGHLGHSPKPAARGLDGLGRGGRRVQQNLRFCLIVGVPRFLRLPVAPLLRRKGDGLVDKIATFHVLPYHEEAEKSSAT